MLMGWSGLPSTFLAMTAFTRFCWPSTVRTDSPCMTRTLMPQPAEHDWQSERTQARQANGVPTGFKNHSHFRPGLYGTGGDLRERDPKYQQDHKQIQNSLDNPCRDLAGKRYTLFLCN